VILQSPNSLFEHQRLLHLRILTHVSREAKRTIIVVVVVLVDLDLGDFYWLEFKVLLGLWVSLE
jgi:hypothetical protein